MVIIGCYETNVHDNSSQISPSFSRANCKAYRHY